jgi:hypothetical protein
MDLSIKHKIKDDLIRKDYVNLVNLCQKDRRFWRALRLYLYESDERLRWPAIEAVAALMKKLWRDGSREKVREYIRGLLWQLNEESGGIGWSSPEVIAEIISSVPELLEPYGLNMLSFALESTALINSSLWAIGRLGKRINGKIDLFLAKVLDAFNSDNPGTLGLAAWAMGEVGVTSALVPLTMLTGREELVRIYVGGHFQEKSLGAWAKEAIVKIDRNDVPCP